jgi:hypothetical protein
MGQGTGNYWYKSVIKLPAEFSMGAKQISGKSQANAVCS